MLLIHIDETEMFDDEKQEFIYINSADLCLEHSLVSISKWESKWHIPFIGNNNLTSEQVIDYIRCMTINKNVSYDTFAYLNKYNAKEISDYINNSYTATTFYEANEGSGRGKGEKVITSELVYYWMVAYNIPFECDKWHINRLLTLIKICSIKNSQDKKMSPSAIRKQNASLNAARRRAHHTKG